MPNNTGNELSAAVCWETWKEIKCSSSWTRKEPFIIFCRNYSSHFKFGGIFVLPRMKRIKKSNPWRILLALDCFFKVQFTLSLYLLRNLARIMRTSLSFLFSCYLMSPRLGMIIRPGCQVGYKWIGSYIGQIKNLNSNLIYLIKRSIFWNPNLPV